MPMVQVLLQIKVRFQAGMRLILLTIAILLGLSAWGRLRQQMALLLIMVKIIPTTTSGSQLARTLRMGNMMIRFMPNWLMGILVK